MHKSNSSLHLIFMTLGVYEASFRYWQANVDVHMKGLELIKPGVRCWYVDQLLYLMKRHSLNEASRVEIPSFQ